MKKIGLKISIVSVVIVFLICEFLIMPSMAIEFGNFGEKQSLFPPTDNRPFPKHTVMTNLQAGHGFAKQSAQGTQADDATDYVKGSQSLKLTSDGIGSAVFTRKINIAPTIDLTGKYIKVWVKVSDVSLLSELWFYVSSDNFAANNYNWKVTDDKSQIKSGVWSSVTLSFGEATVTGAPNRAAINSIQWRIKDTASSAINVNLGGMAAISEPTGGIVTITFDDGWSSQYSEAKKKMDSYDFPGVAYIVPTLIGTANYMTLTQLKEMQDIHGWDISCHTYNHTDLTTLDSSGIDGELRKCKQYLLDNGLHKGADHLSYPNGGWDETNVIPAVKKYFRTGRTIAQFAETIPTADNYRVRVLLVVNTTTTASIQTLVTQAINNKEWLILVFHKIVAAPTVSTEYSIANFGTVIDDINTQGISVKTMSDVIRGE